MAARRKSETRLAMLACLLLAPVAGATEGAGVFGVASVEAPPSARTELSAFAAYLENASEVSAFELMIPSATVTIYQERFLHFLNTPLGPTRVERPAGSQNQTWVVTDGRLRIIGEGAEGEQPRFVGLNPKEGGLQIESDIPYEIKPESHSEFGSKRLASTTAPGSIEYFHREDRPHLYLKTSGMITYTGLGEIKIRGLSVEIATPQETRTFQTGEVATGPGEVTVTFLYIQFARPASLALETGATQVDIAAAEADLAGKGAFSFFPTAGSLRMANGTEASPAFSATARLDGTFRARLEPSLEGREARMEIEGDFHAAGLAFRQVADPAREPSPWGAVVVVGAVLAGTAGGAAFLLRRERDGGRNPRVHLVDPAGTPKANETWTAETCLKAAIAWMEEQDFEKARIWLAHARSLAPTSARLMTEDAFCLGEMGRVEEAVSAYLVAHTYSSDGEAAMGAAFMLLEKGRPTGEILPWLERVLEKTPHWVFALEADFPSATGGPEWRKLRRRALDRMGEGFRPGDSY